MYYLASSMPAGYEDVARRIGMGMILSPRVGRRVAVAQECVVWGADNGCYTQGQNFDLGRYLAWLDYMLPVRSTCLFATAPDVMADAAATLERSLPAFDAIRERGYKAALVSHDGLDLLRVPWETFDALFVGGTTAWKVSEASGRLCHEAVLRGKYVHMGRVNSLKRMLIAQEFGCGSVDGTHLKFRKRGKEEIAHWLSVVNAAKRIAA